MKNSIEKLQKFFRLEAERGYDNHAVMGGLARILENWEVEARNDEIPEELIQAISLRLRDYSRLSESSRAEVLEGVWSRIQQEMSLSSSEKVKQEEDKTPTPETRTTKVEGETPDQDKPDSSQKEQLHPEQGESTLPVTPEVEEPPAALNADITVLPGIGPRNAQALSRLGIETLGDMLYYFPRRYDDYTLLKPINRLEFGEEVTVIGTIQGVSSRKIRGGKAQIIEAVINDGTGTLRISWFNQPWLAKRLKKGNHISISGKIDQYLGRLVMNNPEWEPIEQQQLSTNRIVPIYPLTARMTQRWLRRQMNQVVSYWAPRTRDPIPEAVKNSINLIDLQNALSQVHFPDTWEQLKAARTRLAFDEIFLLQLGVQRQKLDWQSRSAQVFEVQGDWLKSQINRLPFKLTRAQNKALKEILKDLSSGKPMNRLLQGDVGSGKTVIAALAVSIVVSHNAQAVIMAPTSILAEQHYRNLRSILSEESLSTTTQLPLKQDEVRLMIGATPEKEKEELRHELASGRIKLIIGTHALIEDPVIFKNLQIIIIDEQHRFGVQQRSILRSKGTNPHLMVMTATPIPRSLALTIYGDLDLTIMDEMPPGRLDVSTHVLSPNERERAYSLIRSQVQAGRQAFIIYPLVEESNKSDKKSAVEELARLQSEVFSSFNLGLLHGRLNPEEKDETMSRFRDGEVQILVSTSVIEVGVDVPNATVMLIEGANHFGLAQLHQLRGRVGRGAEKSYCLLIPDTIDEIENERLQVMTQTNDGFILAEKDLEQRGPGDFFGTRQSGYPEMRMASLSDVHLIEKAREQAQILFRNDPDLSMAENRYLAEEVRRFWSHANGRGDVS